MHATYESDGPLATLTFNRPEARNAMTWDMYQALVDAATASIDDPAIRVLILRGAGGKAFVAGHRHRAVRGLSRPRRRYRLRAAHRRGARSARARHASRRSRRSRASRRAAAARLRSPAICGSRRPTRRSAFRSRERSATVCRARPTAGWWTCLAGPGEGPAVDRPFIAGSRGTRPAAWSIASSRRTTSRRAVRDCALTNRRERAADGARDKGDDSPHHGRAAPARRRGSRPRDDVLHEP